MVRRFVIRLFNFSRIGTCTSWNLTTNEFIVALCIYYPTMSFRSHCNRTVSQPVELWPLSASSCSIRCFLFLPTSGAVLAGENFWGFSVASSYTREMYGRRANGCSTSHSSHNAKLLNSKQYLRLTIKKELQDQNPLFAIN